MNIFKRIKSLVIILLIIVSATSCLDMKENEETVYGDAFIRATQLTETTVGYNLELFAYSMSEMSQVETYHDQSSLNITLQSVSDNYTFAYQPSETVYSEELPVSGIYFFDATFANGAFYHGSDFLMTTHIDPPKIKKIEWNNEDKNVTIEWVKDEKAHLYRVTLLDENGKIAFESDLLENTISDLWISQFTQGWYTNRKPASTTTYTVLVSSYLFEPVVSTFDIQCIATNGLQKFVWNLEQ